MPRLRLREKERRHELPDELTLCWLLAGDLVPMSRRDPPIDAEEQWSFYRDAVMRLHVFGTPEEFEALGLFIHLLYNHCGPGTRPFAWWEYDAPQPHRRRIDPSGPAPHGDDWRYGVPYTFVGSALAGERDPVWYETEEAYLRRHRLLLPGESALLK